MEYLTLRNEDYETTPCFAKISIIRTVYSSTKKLWRAQFIKQKGRRTLHRGKVKSKMQ